MRSIGGHNVRGVQVLGGLDPDGRSRAPRRPTSVVASSWFVRWGYAVVGSAFVLVVLLAGPRHYGSGDTAWVLPVANSIVHERDLDIEEFPASDPAWSYNEIEMDGTRYSYFPWLVSVLVVPVVLTLDGAHTVGVGPGFQALSEEEVLGPQLEKAVASAVVAAIAGVAAMLVFARCSALAPRRRAWLALGVAVTFCLGTSAASIASRGMWQHGPSMLALTIALLSSTRMATSGSRVWAVGCGAALGAAYAFRPTNAIVVVALLAWIVLKERSATMWVLLGATFVAVPWVLVNIASFGHPLAPYHRSGGLSLHSSLAEAVAANLVSPGRGMVVFTPIVLLSGAGLLVAWRHRREGDSLELAAAVGVLGYLVAVSMFAATWWGGHTYGPRFLSDTLPLLLVMALPALEWVMAPIRSPVRRCARAAIGVAVIWGFSVHLSPMVFPASACWNVSPRNIDEDPSRVWDWHRPQFAINALDVMEHGPIRARTVGCDDGQIE